MPEPPATIALHLLNAGGELGVHADALRTSLEAAIAAAAPRLPLQGVDVVAYHDPAATIPELGAGGYTPSAHRVFLPLDVQRRDADPAAFGDALRRLLAHELHHCARWAGPGYGSTLGEALVSEGLACLFETEVWGGPPPFYARALQPAPLAAAAARARAGWNQADYAHATWFYGARPDDLPRHAGYALGLALAARRAARTGHCASSLVHAPADAFLADLPCGPLAASDAADHTE